jgi:hypothetical protein
MLPPKKGALPEVLKSFDHYVHCFLKTENGTFAATRASSSLSVDSLHCANISTFSFFSLTID